MYLKIRVFSDSKKESLEKVDEETFKIYTRAPAERGLANSRVVEMLSEIYPNTKIRIVSGHQSPSKIVAIGN
jgi:uncharacterized protein (TIGR00251 family)